MTKELERRLLREPVVLRATADGPGRIGGYALKFNKLSRNLGGWVEQIDPGSLKTSHGEGWPGVMARYNHEMLLGTTAADSLRLAVDGTGLDYEVDLLDDPASQRVRMLVER
ncbi:MAG: HK97 family phage prohead protease, partial [Solimonas sp.]